MVRVALLSIALAACSKSAGNQEKPSAAPPPPAAEKAAAEPPKAGCGSADDPKFFLKPDEGTLTIDKVDASAGAQATAAVKVAPATGYHMSTDFPISLCLEPPPGVTIAKTAFAAGKGQQGDADAFGEQGLAFSVKATADKPGSYEVKGIFKFGVCDKESCHPKKQPITITVAAK
jgi:hypothetical protein